MKTHRFIRSLTQMFPWLLVGPLGLAGIASAASDPGAELKRSLGSIFEKALTGVANPVAPPGPNLPASGGSGGLTAEYFDNQDLRGPAKISRVDPVINFDWSYGSPGPGVPDDHFGARWTGQIQPRFSETYVFTGNRDNGFRLWIDGQLLVDLWNNQWGNYESRPIALQAGRRHAIKIEYYEDYGGTAVSLKWRSASQPEEVVPASQLFPAATTGPADSGARPPIIDSGGTTITQGKFDRTQWFATRGSWNNRFGEGAPYDDSAIELEGNVITLKADRTDQVAALYSRPFALTPGDVLSIKRSVLVHAANRKFEGCLTAYAVDDPAVNATKPAYEASLFNLGYRNFDYETDQNLFALSDGKSFPPGPGKFAGGTAPTTPPLWDQWFDEELRYDSGSGETVYLINGRERLRFRAAALSKPYVKLLLHPYGWGTGHFVKMKNIEISVSRRGTGDGGDQPVADLRTRLLATPYQWADNGTPLGTIVFSADQSGRTTWSGDIHYWKLEIPDQLVIAANGTTYVTRLTYQPSDRSFSGARDRTSQVQDGVRTVLRPTTPPPPPGGGTGTGLLGEYFDNPDLRGAPKITRVDYGISTNWGDDSPGPGIPADNFSVRWTGEIQPRYSESYVFRGSRDDGVRVWIDDRLIIDEWKGGDSASFASAPMTLTAGRRHKIRVEYLEQSGKARIDLRWQSPSQPDEVVPARCLLHVAASREPNRGLPDVRGDPAVPSEPKVLARFFRLMADGKEDQAAALTTDRLRQASADEKQIGREIGRWLAEAETTGLRINEVQPGMAHVIVRLKLAGGREAVLFAEFVESRLNRLDWRTHP